MLSKRTIAVVVGICLAASGALATTYKDPAVEYAADQHMSAEGHRTMAKVFHAHQKLRMEMEGAVTINRMDKKVVWMLVPQMSAYQEHAINDPQFGPRGPDAEGANVDITPMGTETVNGVETTKNKMVSTDPQGHRVEGTMWLSKEGIMVKGIFTDPSQGNKTVTIELKNLRIAKQDPGLFEIPAGYAKMPAMGMGGYPAPGPMPTAAPPPRPAPEPVAPAPQPTGRAYTAQPRQSEPDSQGDQTVKNVNEGLDSINKLKGLFGK